MKQKVLAGLLAAAILISVSAAAFAEEAHETYPVRWDLESVYASAEEWNADYDRAMELLDRYDSFRGTLHDAKNIYEYLQFSHYSELSYLESRLDCYAHLGSRLDPTDPVFREMNAKLNAMYIQEARISSFAIPEIYANSLEDRAAIFSDPVFDGYAYSLKDFADPDRQPLGEEAADAMAIVSMGLGYPYNIYLILDSVEMPYSKITMPDGTEADLTNELYNAIIYSDEYEESFKAEACEKRFQRIKPFRNTLAMLLEENAAQAYASALLDHYETTREMALAEYDVEPEIYDLLIEAAHRGASDHERYLKAHARGIGVEEQYPYHLGTPVSGFTRDSIAYEDAVSEVTEALGILGEDYIAKFMEIIRSGHVDVYPTDTKATGAFEDQSSPEFLPWVLFNYTGLASDVVDIAHEMGHAVYDAFATENQPLQYQDPTVFTQEIASTANELLYFHYRMQHAADEEEKLFYLENSLKSFSETFFTQVMFAEFEDIMYQAVEGGIGLDVEAMSAEYDRLMKFYEGNGMIRPADNRYRWLNIRHFYQVYYVYQYATSITYAASIVQRILNGEEGAVEDYLAFLKLGRSARPSELLATAGVDPLQKETYQRALDYFSSLVDEYERMVDARLATDALSGAA